ncbi:MAG: hypothetical protein WDO74_29240 [Pseudomonadota bacterium]
MCGNVTLAGRLSEDESSALPERAQLLLRQMLRVSQMRGAQSGGGAVQIGQGGQARQLIRKCVNTKRGDLATRLTRVLRRSASSRAAFGGTFIAQTHVRYATAGLTSKHEAHPFRFVDLAQRGPRRVWSFVDGEPALSLRPVETALTHNGDMDGLRFRGTSIAYAELGLFLERVLGVPNRWSGDSPVLAAAIELYLTQGMWLESLRLAHHQTVAPAAPDFSVIASDLAPAKRAEATRALLASYPAPSVATLSEWEGVAEAVLRAAPFTQTRAASGSVEGARRKERELFAQRLSERLTALNSPELPGDRTLVFARAAVNAFFDNDLYIALRKLEPGLDGTFGCVVTSTLEAGSLVALCRGQPLSLGFERSTHSVCVVSERAAMKVPDGLGEPAFAERIDLDLCRGEIARVLLSGAQPLQLTLYGIADGREFNSDELVAAGRLVPIRNNPYVSPLPPSVGDRVAADMLAIAPHLARVRHAWQDESSPNRQTAEAFTQALLRRAKPRLLVLGITNDLWLAQQFVRNLKTLFPELEASAKSSNEILLEEASLVLDEHTVVLAVSQAGQDFPTLGALTLLRQRLAALGQDAVFVLTGEIDSLMGQAVGQSYARGRQFSARIFSNLTGFRPSEAALATVNATHHTFVELLLSMARQARDSRYFNQPPHGFTLSAQDLQALLARRDFTVDLQAKAITQTVSPQVLRQARRWTSHVLEGAFGFAALLLLLELNLQFDLGLLPSRWLGFALGLAHALPAGAARVAQHIGSQLDVLFYAFFAPLAVWALRRVQGRPTFHRQGTRELLIGDTPYVHQIVWLLSKKLFSLSYGFASIKAYSADCRDELIMTHEPLRGTLALIGIPDARSASLRARGAAALMTAKQFNNSRSLSGAGAEIITISHAPAAPGTAFGAHLALGNMAPHDVSTTVEVLFEDMFDSWERLMAMQTFVERLARGVSAFWPLRYDRSRTKDQVFAPTTAAPVSAAAIYQLLARTSERYAHVQEGPLPFEVVRSGWRGTAPAAKTTAWRSWTDGDGPGA